MRVLLAAMQCDKGDLSTNVARRVELMGMAYGAGCGLAVFREFSLTGSAHRATQPGRALTLDDRAVGRLVDDTARGGVGALVGFAEQRGAGCFVRKRL